MATRNSRGIALALLAAFIIGPPSAAQEADSIGLELVAEGFNSPVHLTAPADDDRRFVVDRAGYIYVLDGDGNLLDEPFLDLSDDIVDLREQFDERGLLGLVFHPNYADNGRFYVYYSVPLRDEAPDDWDHTSRISEFKMDDENPDAANPDSERVLIEVDQPQFNHNAGSLAFGPGDGYLYIALGDGGAADDVALGHPPIGHGQDITSMLGNILRIDVDRGWPGYAVPQDNPLVGQEGVDEAYAWGWRNPWRMSFDRGGDNALFVATNGQNLWEAVYRVAEPGNYGWNIMEGTHCFDPENPDETPPDDACPSEGANGEPLMLPVIEYPHLANQGDSDVAGISVIGGYVYRGESLADMQGNYIFGDWSQSFSEPAGQVLMATPGGDGELWSVQQLLELESYVLGFGEDSAGELYVLTTDNTGPTGNTGRVYLVAAGGLGTTGGNGGDGEGGGGEDGDGQEGAAQDEGAEGGDGQGEAAEDGQGEKAGERSGWFTAEQAEHGMAEYQEYCQECHGADLQAEDPFPALTGNTFMSRWEGSSAADLFEYISSQMPLGNPGGLEQETYVDILAFWLDFHDFPQGEQELTADPEVLEQIAIEPQGD